MKIEGQTLLVLGALGAAAYLVYKISKSPVGQFVSGGFGLIGDTVSGVAGTFTAGSAEIAANSKALVKATEKQYSNYQATPEVQRLKSSSALGQLGLISGTPNAIQSMMNTVSKNNATKELVSPKEQARGVQYARDLYANKNPLPYGIGSKPLSSLTNKI
jgi:hypothetical protein